MSSPIIDKAALKKLAGESTFQAGMHCYQAGIITDFQNEYGRLRAQFGEYTTTVNVHQDALEGACNCPESDGFEFCQHCVALCLHSNKVSQQLLALSQGPDKSKILSYLLQLDKQELAKQFLAVIDQDTALRKRFLLKASLDKQSVDYSALKSQVTQLTKVDKRLFSQRQVKHFFARIASFLNEIVEYGDYDEPEKMTRVVEYCVSRINKLLRSTDDSSNQRAEVSKLLQTLYAQLLAGLSGSIEHRVKRLYRHWLNDQYALLGHDITVFFPGADEDICKQFDRLVQQSWQRSEKHAQRPPSETAKDDALENWQIDKLAQHLLKRAQESHDIETEINLRASLVRTVDDHLTLAEKLHERGELPQAIRFARAALNLEPSSVMALEYLIGLMELKNDLLEPFIELFAEHPEAVADTLLAYAERHGQSEWVVQQCIDILRSKAPSHSHLLLRLLLQGKCYAEAIALSQTQTLRTDELIKLADAIAVQDPEHALTLYQRAVSELIKTGLNKRYEHALTCIESLRPLMQEPAFVDYIGALAQLHRNKTAFVQLLNQSFSTHL